jgi:hypothetical protein
MTGHSILSAHITDATWFRRLSALSFIVAPHSAMYTPPTKLSPLCFSKALSAAVYGIDANIIDVDRSWEAAVVEGVNVYPVESLNEVRELLNAAANGGILARLSASRRRSPRRAGALFSRLR